MTHVRTALLTATCASALLLSACGGDTDGTPVSVPTGGATTGSAAEETTSSSAAPSPSTSAKDVPAGDVTAPGTELAVGDRAVVPFKYGTDKTGTIAVTVTAIEQGANADLAKFGDKAKGITPFYIRVSVENVGGTDLSYSSVSLRGLGADGKGSGVIISGDTDKCESETAARDFTTAGAKYETCVLSAAREGSAITGASFDKGGDAYVDDPIVWKN
ncbi:hypothetical protein [Saccharothrix yanglingensis]|uniref:Lipoprotein n=1 Tax=Saccharothrix yanglingensis TaxID=659496 RepID=A0ABU0WWZ9_9PSEU|nr:hypothetical protein [Saccharothrix yanglingensis]MDQ2584380.1 hypothetical protein [Saccharothrix yanglingensis]